MKKLIIGALALSMIGMYACQKDIDVKNINKDVNIKNTNYGFNESVAIIYIGKGETSEGTEYINLDIKSFNPLFNLQDSYYIDGTQYTDDGNFNDKIARDGIYSSIQSGTISTENNDLIVNINPNFQFKTDLLNYINDNYITAAGPGISIGCDVSLVECSETDWWNSCWPLSSPCTCVEFSNCHVEVSYSF